MNPPPSALFYSGEQLSAVEEVGFALRLSDLAQRRQEPWRIDDPGTLVLSNGQEMPSVAGYQVIGIGDHRTLKDSVVGVAALNQFREPRRVKDGGGVC